MLPDATEKRYQWRISNVCYRRRDGRWLHSRGDHDVFGGNDLRPPSCSRVAASPRRWHPTSELSYATRVACAAAPRHPHAACVAACAVPCRPRRSPAPSPRRVRSNPTPCHRPRSCPMSPHEDAIGERERIEEKGYGRERRGCRMKIRKKEEKW
jgi:hypothetical protein